MWAGVGDGDGLLEVADLFGAFGVIATVPVKGFCPIMVDMSHHHQWTSVR